MQSWPLYIALTSAFIFTAGALENKAEKLRELEKEILDLLLKDTNGKSKDKRVCKTPDPFDLNVSDDDAPSPLEVNECIDRQLTSGKANPFVQSQEFYKFATSAHCENEFDTTQCDTTDCVLGHETDESGCVVSCACKAEGLLESDIMLNEEDVALLEDEKNGDGMNRAGARYKRRWNNIREGSNFVVPYTINPSVGNNPRASAAISAAIEQYAKQTCLRFRPRTSEKDYIEFFRGAGCYSYIGRTGRGKQQISIGRGCEYKGIVMHEMMHAMGFWHEHSRPDRDEKVSIIYDNINPKFHYNFKKMPERMVSSFGSKYDIGSIMQYGGFSFSKNRKPTILTAETGVPVKHQRKGFSEEDAKQLNQMMKCNI